MDYLAGLMASSGSLWYTWGALEFQIPEFDQFPLNSAVAGILVAENRKGCHLGA